MNMAFLCFSCFLLLIINQFEFKTYSILFFIFKITFIMIFRFRFLSGFLLPKQKLSNIQNMLFYHTGVPKKEWDNDLELLKWKELKVDFNLKLDMIKNLKKINTEVYSWRKGYKRTKNFAKFCKRKQKY